MASAVTAATDSAIVDVATIRITEVNRESCREAMSRE